MNFIITDDPEDDIGVCLAGTFVHVKSTERILLDPDASDYHAPTWSIHLFII